MSCSKTKASVAMTMQQVNLEHS